MLFRSSGGSRHSRLASVPCLVAPALAVLAALSALALLALLARSLVSRASRSMIARFLLICNFYYFNSYFHVRAFTLSLLLIAAAVLPPVLEDHDKRAATETAPGRAGPLNQIIQTLK